MANRADIKAGGAFVTLFLKDNLTGPLAKTLNKAGKSMKKFGDSMSKVGKTMFRFGAAATLPLALSLRTFAKFDDEMRTVGAVTRASEDAASDLGDELGMLTAKAKLLGATTSFTAIQVAELMTVLGRAGFDPSQVDDMTQSVLNLARATKTEAAVAAGIMSTGIRQFGLAATDATRISDGFTVAANQTFNTVEQLGSALSKAGPVAADLGLTFEETVAILGTLGNIGIQGEEAGTALKRISLTASAEAEKLKKIFGVEFQDINNNALPLVDVLERAAQATAGLGSAARAAKFNEAFGLRGITGAGAIGRSAGSTRDLLRDIKEGALTAEIAAQKMDAGIGGSFRIFKSAVEGLAISVGEALAPAVQKLTDRFRVQVTKLIEWVGRNKEMVKGIFAAVLGFTAAGGALFVFGKIIAGVGTALVILAAAITAIASPIGLVTIALVAGTVAWAKYTDAGKATVKFFKTTFGEIKTIVQDTVKGITDAFAGGDLQLALKIAFTGIKTAALSALEGLSDLMGPTFAKIALKLKSGDFVGAFQTSFTLIGEGFAVLGRGIVKTWVAVADSIVDIAHAMALDIVRSFNNPLLLKLLGVDAAALESDLLDRQLSRTEFGRKTGSPSAVNQIKSAAGGAVDETADELKEKLADLGTAYTDIYDGLLAGLREGAEGSTEEIKLMRAEAEMELVILGHIAEQKKKAAAKAAEPTFGPRGKPGGGVGPGPGGLAGAAQQGAAFATFSAAAAVGAGGIAVKSAQKTREDMLKEMRENKLLAREEVKIAAADAAHFKMFLGGFLMRP